MLGTAEGTMSDFEQWVASLPVWGQFPVVLGVMLPVCIALAWVLLRTIDAISGWVRAASARRGLGYDESTLSPPALSDGPGAARHPSTQTDRRRKLTMKNSQVRNFLILLIVVILIAWGVAKF